MQTHTHPHARDLVRTQRTHARTRASAQALVRGLLQGHDSRLYVHVLHSLIVNEGETLTRNQELVLRYFLSAPFEHFRAIFLKGQAASSDTQMQEIRYAER